MSYYVVPLHAGHWYLCRTTHSTRPTVPTDLDRAYDTKAMAEDALRVANARADGLDPRPLTVPWVEVDQETAYGTTCRLSRSIRVF